MKIMKKKTTTNIMKRLGMMFAPKQVVTQGEERRTLLCSRHQTLKRNPLRVIFQERLKEINNHDKTMKKLNSTKKIFQYKLVKMLMRFR